MSKESVGQQTVNIRPPYLRGVGDRSASIVGGEALLLEPTPEAPLPFGRYQLIRRIGAGGMGEVFLAREANGAQARACVVKKILPNLVENRAFVGRFLDEAKVVVRLNHPNIAHVYAMGDVAGEYFLAMEYVAGKTVSRFSRRLREQGREMPLGLVLLIGERVCRGLHYAHEACDENDRPLHLVHRDLSPANVCISYGGEVKIIDFGAAHSTLKEEQTAPRVVIGNLTYMSPEQARKQRVDGRADVYSCGVMLWELLAWHALPQKGDPIERWRRAANPSWEAPSSMTPTVPPDVDDIVLRALKKTPAERFPDAWALAEALRHARLRHAPGATEEVLGDLLSRSFAIEKQGEDAVLREVVYGRAAGGLPGEDTRSFSVVPPTALAFEHTAVLAPAELLSQLEAATNGGVAPSPSRRASVAGEPPPPPADAFDDVAPGPDSPHARTPSSRRAGFGVTFAEAAESPSQPSLVSEIEGIEDANPSASLGAPGASAGGATSSLTRRRLGRTLGLSGIFVAAVGLGFLGVWLYVR